MCFVLIFWLKQDISTCFYIYFSVLHFKWWRFESIHCSGWCATTPSKLLQTQELLKKMCWFINRFSLLGVIAYTESMTESHLVFQQMKSVWNQLHRMMSTLENIQTSGCCCWTCENRRWSEEKQPAVHHLCTVSVCYLCKLYVSWIFSLCLILALMGVLGEKLVLHAWYTVNSLTVKIYEK